MNFSIFALSLVVLLLSSKVYSTDCKKYKLSTDGYCGPSNNNRYCPEGQNCSKYDQCGSGWFFQHYNNKDYDFTAIPKDCQIRLNGCKHWRISTNGKCGGTIGYEKYCPGRRHCSSAGWCGYGKDYKYDGQPKFDGDRVPVYCKVKSVINNLAEEDNNYLLSDATILENEDAYSVFTLLFILCVGLISGYVIGNYKFSKSKAGYDNFQEGVQLVSGNY